MEEENKSKGFIKLYRSLLTWEWHDDPNTISLFIHCLLLANHKDGKWHGVDVPRGCFVSSIPSLAEKTGMSERNIRTALKHLKATGEVTGKSTNKYTIFKVEKYDQYQSDDRQSDRQMTGNCQATARQPTTNNKSIKKEVKKERKTTRGDGDGFVVSFETLKSKYSPEVADCYLAYYNHWAKKPSLEEQNRWIQQLDLCGSNAERVAAIRYSSGMNPAGTWYRGIYADSVNKASTYDQPEEPNLPDWYAEVPEEKATKKEIDAVIALQKAVAAGDAEAAERIQATILQQGETNGNPIN